jgi:hypothetical protein
MSNPLPSSPPDASPRVRPLGLRQYRCGKYWPGASKSGRIKSTHWDWSSFPAARKSTGGSIPTTPLFSAIWKARYASMQLQMATCSSFERAIGQRRRLSGTELVAAFGGEACDLAQVIEKKLPVRAVSGLRRMGVNHGCSSNPRGLNYRNMPVGPPITQCGFGLSFENSSADHAAKRDVGLRSRRHQGTLPAISSGITLIGSS